MKDDFYRQLLKTAPLGYAYHRMIYNAKKEPVDYEYLDVNNVFADMLGMKEEEILGRRVTELVPGIKEDDFDWICYYDAIAREGEEKEFEQYSQAIDKWYYVKAYSVQEETFVTFLMDVTDSKKAMRDLERQQNQLRTIIDIDPNYIFAKDEEGVYLLANKAVSSIFHLTPEEVEGKTDKYWTKSEEQYQHFRKDDLEVIHSEQAKIIPKEAAPRPDGTMGWFQTVKIPYEHPGHSLPAVLGVSTDITERVLAEEALKEYNEKLQLANIEMEKSLSVVQEANQVKTDFLANMSHEIRTPLNAVIGMGQLALDETKDPTMGRYLKQMIKSGHNLLQMINDILDYAQLEAGRLSMKEQVFSVEKLVQEVADIFVSRAQQKDITLKVSVDELVPDFLMGDKTRLKQVLMNLMSNAVKFTYQGKIELSVQQVVENSQQVHLQFQVRDTGIGIPMEKMDKLFKPFSQADSSITRQHEGTGLGLSISRQLVILMGGNLWVKSQPGQGATFIFQIPFEAASDLLTSFDEMGELWEDSHKQPGIRTDKREEQVSLEELLDALEQHLMNSSFIDDQVVLQLGRYLNQDPSLKDTYKTLKDALAAFDYESSRLIVKTIKIQLQEVQQ